MTPPWWSKTPAWWRCPYCGAKRGYRCMSPSGYLYDWFHTARWARSRLPSGIRGVGYRA